jgi:hypothetical protein
MTLRLQSESQLEVGRPNAASDRHSVPAAVTVALGSGSESRVAIIIRFPSRTASGAQPELSHGD